jgi:hypothetical protein
MRLLMASVDGVGDVAMGQEGRQALNFLCWLNAGAQSAIQPFSRVMTITRLDGAIQECPARQPCLHPIAMVIVSLSDIYRRAFHFPGFVRFQPCGDRFRIGLSATPSEVLFPEPRANLTI